MKKPNKKQFNRIKKAFLKKKKIKIVRSTKWYHFIKRRIAVKCLKAWGIQNAYDFLAARFVLIPLRKKNLLFAPRALDPKRPIDALCLLTHEGHHVDQVDGDPVGYGYRYLNQFDRMSIEGDAYAAEEPVRNLWGYSKANRKFGRRWGKVYSVTGDALEAMNNRYQQRIEAAYSPKSTDQMIAIIKKVMN